MKQKSILLQASRDYNYNLKIQKLLFNNRSLSKSQREVYQDLYYKLAAVNPNGYQNMWHKFIYPPVNVLSSLIA